MIHRSVRLLVLVIVIAGLVAGLVTIFSPIDPAQRLEQARAALDRADAAHAAKDYAGALAAFAEAEQRLQESWKGLDKSSDKAKNAADDKQRAARGQIFWLRARLIRDRAFAQAAKDDKALTETLDTTTGTKFRSFLYIPEEGQRKEAVVFLRQAAELLPDQEAILLECLRTELQLPGPNWVALESVSRKILKLRPQDARALYILARVEFEQPAPDAPATPTPAHKRKEDRVRRSLELVRQLKTTPGHVTWRTWHLEAQCQSWLMHQALKRQNMAVAQKAQYELGEILWGKVGEQKLGEPNGALEKVTSGKYPTQLSSWDVDGIFGLYHLALDTSLIGPIGIQGTSGNVTRYGKTIDVMDQLLSFCKRRHDEKSVSFPSDLLVLNAMAALVKVQPALAAQEPAQWTKLLGSAQAILRDSLNNQRVAPAGMAMFADFLLWEARQQAAQGRTAEAAKVRERASAWLDDCLRAADDAKLDAASQAPLHLTKAYFLLARGAGKREAAEAHLQAVRGLKEPRLHGYTLLLETLADLRGGHLERVQEHLDQCPVPLPAELTVRAQVLQTMVYLAVGNVDKALPSLRILDKTYAGWDRLNVIDRLWLQDFFPSREHLTALLAQTQLDLARDRFQRFAQQNPGRTAPAELLQHHEKQVAQLIAALPAGSPVLARLLQAQALYLVATNRPELARGPLEELRTKAPSIAYWTTQLVIYQGDKRLQEALESSVKQNPGDAAARWALAVAHARAGRHEQALAQLPAAAVPGDLFLPEQLEALGQLFAQARRPDLAASFHELFKSAQARYPYDPRVSFALGLTQASLGHREAARDNLRRALNLTQGRAPQMDQPQRVRLVNAVNSALENLQAP